MADTETLRREFEAACQAEIDIEALADKIAESLTSAYVCTRVWSAWNVGTMTEDDFKPADESELSGEIAEKVVEFISGQRKARKP
jgi:HEPN domain-containing protein